jgi:hypothetical protein
MVVYSESFETHKYTVGTMQIYLLLKQVVHIFTIF